MAEQNEKLFYTTKEAAKRLNIQPRRIWEIIKSGDLEAYTMDRRYLISSEEIEKLEEKFYSNDLTLEQIAEYNGLPYESIRLKFRKYRIKPSGETRIRKHRPASTYSRETLDKIAHLINLRIPPASV
jgi:excisionase family DNA binding protein